MSCELFSATKIPDIDDLQPAVRRLLLPTETGTDTKVDTVVGDIIDQVRRRGDAALVELTQRFDRLELTAAELFLSPAQIAELAAEADPPLRRAIDGMIENVRRFHERQTPKGFVLSGPTNDWVSWRYRPVQAAAVYVPGGTAAYPTSVVMNVVPARVAGVSRIMAVTPPRALRENPAVAYALTALGVEEVLGVGGAQGIAAAAYGTQSVQPVDVIVGPGNAYVASAKRQVFGRVGIDSVAGPSEVVIVADHTAPPEWIALDLMAQAEHDPLARCILLTDDFALAQAVQRALVSNLPKAPRRAIIEASLTGHGLSCVVPNLDAAVRLTNRIAPEHLQVMVADTSGLSAESFVAGAVFWGPHTPTAVGDYWAGPNHVLPTGGTARYRGPLGVNDFLVPTSTVCYTAESGASLAHAIRMAEAEGLYAHAASLRARCAGGDDATG